MLENNPSSKHYTKRASNLELIKSNLKDLNARHLMLLTQNNAALNMLFDFELLSMGKTDVIFGSDFPDDNTNFSISLDLQACYLQHYNFLTFDRELK